MSDIALSRAVRTNLLSLQNTASMMETAQGRLATGKKVNSALDNPTNFFTASSLNSRAGDINALLDGMANGIQTLEAANNGLKAMTKSLESMQSTLRQARQDKSFETASYEVSLGEDGKFAASSTITFAGGAGLGTSDPEAPVSVNVAGLTLDEAIEKINSATQAPAEAGGTTTPNPLHGKVRASNDNGKLRIENISTQELTVGGTTSVGGGKIEGNSIRADLVNQYNELRDQLDKLADDASFNGINLLRGDEMKITFNESGTSDITIKSMKENGINATSLGLDTHLKADAFDSDAEIDAQLDKIKGAINEVRSQASAFGSSLSIVENRQEFSKNMINTLQTGAANLTLADTNEEAANLLALQTRQQLSSTALSMASQADQAVLRLF